MPKQLEQEQTEQLPEITDEEVVMVVTEMKRLAAYLEFMDHQAKGRPEMARFREDLELWWKASLLASRFLERAYKVVVPEHEGGCGRPDCPDCGAPPGEVVH